MINPIKLAAFQIALTKTIGHVPRGDLGDDEKVGEAVALALRIANTAVAMWGDEKPTDIADRKAGGL